MDKKFKIPAWMLEVEDDAPAAQPKPTRGKPQGQRKYQPKTTAGKNLSNTIAERMKKID